MTQPSALGTEMLRSARRLRAEQSLLTDLVMLDIVAGETCRDPRGLTDRAFRNATGSFLIDRAAFCYVAT